MNSQSPSKAPILLAWIVILAIALPKIILQEIFKIEVSPDQQALLALSVITVALLATLAVHALQGLRPFLALFAVVVCSQWLVYNRIDTLPFYRTWLKNPSFNVNMLAEQSLNLMVMLLVIAALLVMRKTFAGFFLRRGEIDAPATPIRWLGVKAGDRWRQLGLILTLCISLGTLTFLIIAGRPPLDIVVRALPFLPAVLLAAVINALTEEVSYKASFLSVLQEPVGARQALGMVAAYFGIAHFYGVPYGVIGVLLAGFMGWILARSMLDTKGLFWAWFIHFWQDVWIFSFMAIGSIIPGGG